MTTHQLAQTHAAPVAVLLLLLPVLACAVRDSIGPEVEPRIDEGALVGRVEVVGSGEAARDQGRGPGSANGPILVYLEPDFDAEPAVPIAPPIEIRIKDGRQHPELALVTPDRPFQLQNLDPIHHEPFSLQAPNPFRVRIGGREVSKPIRLSHSGFVRAFCGLHPRETFAFIVSTAHHLVAVDRNGRFELAKVGSGLYRVRAAGVDVESRAIPVRISRGETVELRLRLSPRSRR